MNNDEAKFRLRAYRPSGQDANDPAFAEALAQAERDPALRAWHAREQAFDAIVAARLRVVAPPAGLRESILAGARVGPQRAWWRQPGWWAIAASIALLLSVATLALRPYRAQSLTEFARFALDDMQHGRHGGHGAAVTAFATLLANPQTHLGGELPVDFTQLRATGCRTIKFAGHDVLEVCFQRGGAEFHFYVLGREAMPGATGSRLLAIGGAAGAAWSDAHHIYAVVGDGGIEAIRRLL
jgi:hypothetical protein